ELRQLLLRYPRRQPKPVVLPLQPVVAGRQELRGIGMNACRTVRRGRARVFRGRFTDEIRRIISVKNGPLRPVCRSIDYYPPRDSAARQRASAAEAQEELWEAATGRT